MKRNDSSFVFAARVARESPVGSGMGNLILAKTVGQKFAE